MAFKPISKETVNDLFKTDQANDRRTRNQVSHIAKMARSVGDPIGPEIGDVLTAAVRVALANRIGAHRVYWYGPSTTHLLAREDLEILFREADTLADTLGYGPTDCEDAWHGETSEEPDSERSPDD